MPTRNVVLTDHQSTLIDRLVAEGRYQNASEALREGLRLVEERELARRAMSEYADELLGYAATLDEGDWFPVEDAFARASGKARDA